jgi:hypothetical protein
MTLEAEVANHGDSNNVISLVEAKFVVPISPDEGKPDVVLIHVRFHPNAQIFTIDSRPEHISPQDWFYLLCYAAPQQYQVFAGGRGFFRMRRGHFEAILSQNAA